jgi:endonuclease/exonuclease/phosphatase family metal-dependent hydrolase
MRVATYNVHDCVGRDGRFAPGRIIAVLAEIEADLVALQEVTLDAAGGLIGRLEKATRLHAIDGSLFARGIGRYGNLLLTRDLPLSSRLHDLSRAGREPRGCIEAHLAPGGGRLRVFATHLGLQRGERLFQLGRLAAAVAASRRPALVLGDFNVWAGSAALGPLVRIGLRHRPVRSYPTWPVPIAALDRILAQPPLALARCRRHDSPLSRVASDHFPVVADVRLISSG